jgi:hypothetical protein
MSNTIEFTSSEGLVKVAKDIALARKKNRLQKQQAERFTKVQTIHNASMTVGTNDPVYSLEQIFALEDFLNAKLINHSHEQIQNATAFIVGHRSACIGRAPVANPHWLSLRSWYCAGYTLGLVDAAMGTDSVPAWVKKLRPGYIIPRSGQNPQPTADLSFLDQPAEIAVFPLRSTCETTLCLSLSNLKFSQDLNLIHFDIQNA